MENTQTAKQNVTAAAKQGLIEGLLRKEGALIIIESHPGECGSILILHSNNVRNLDEVESAEKLGRWAVVEYDPDATALQAHRVSLSTLKSTAPDERLITDWSYQKIFDEFKADGCSVAGCHYHNSGAGSSNIYYCALNLSDAILRAGYSLPSATNVKYCDLPQPAHSNPRVRNADGMARIVKSKNGGRIDRSGWANRPAWKGIVFFEGGPDLTGATGHIDLWDGSDAVHKSYPTASVVWFWQLDN